MKLHFKCNHNVKGDKRSVGFVPVNESDENKAAFAGEPGGKLVLEGLSADAQKQFVAGQDYVIEISPAV